MKITPLDSWVVRKICHGKDHLTREIIDNYQLQKLHETIGWARLHSSFYRARLAGFREGELSCLEDLARLPFTTAEDLRRYPMQFLCVSQSEISRVVTLPTSGTTGDPKRIYFTLDDQEQTIDFFCQGMSTMVGHRDRVLILLPGERPGSVGDLLARGLERLGAVVIPHGLVKDVSSTLDVMERKAVDTLVGIPVQVLALARLGDGRAAPRNVLLSTDHVPHAITGELRSIWGCEVFNHYGMTEMGYGGGVDCQAHVGYHMREGDLYVEIVDPATGSTVAAGRRGEVVFTTLTRCGMPLIRYRTGDTSRFVAEQCPCGTLLMSMERVKGRLAGDVQLGAMGVLSMADLDEALFGLPGLLDFSAVLTSENEKNRLHIEISAMETNERKLAASVKSALCEIPCVQAASEEGTLLATVDVRMEGYVPEKGMGKRMIVDHRRG
jgi:phenylacetate-CoA ligase